ncbi:hypothetical protein QK289_04235 [Exiguobacterium antarcticum]|uniref:Transmembrane protein n=1 Tax=Exiguobacterium antarcticum TaxID=132920 RepID=A0ABT6R082_9BACL|nr:hypothetical protein [Exiguobacterium antarcticum]MDI3234207.1 hypothetical protein [Exiguobacterium antarcticum]
MSPEAFVMMMTVWFASLFVVVPLFIIEGREEREAERKQADMKKGHHSEER